jgi:hypothetical protein
MPAGVGVIRQKDKTVLVGSLSYVRISTKMCSVCQEMESAVASRSWFVQAQAEYRDEIKVKNELLASSGSAPV